MTPNKLPPLPELVEKIIAGCAPYTVVHPNGTRLKEITVKESVLDEFLQAVEALRQSQSLPAGAVAGLVGKWREDSETLSGLDDKVTDAVSNLLAQNADELEQALQADAREKGEAVVQAKMHPADFDEGREDKLIRFASDACEQITASFDKAEKAEKDGRFGKITIQVDWVELYNWSCTIDMLSSYIKETQPAQASEPIAYCDPSDPRNSAAFAWPGTAREARCSTPLYTHPQPVTPAGGEVFELLRQWRREVGDDPTKFSLERSTLDAAIAAITYPPVADASLVECLSGLRREMVTMTSTNSMNFYIHRRWPELIDAALNQRGGGDHG